MARRYSLKVKFQIVLEVLTRDRSVAQIARAYGVHPNSVNAWRRSFLEKGPELFAQDNESKVYERHIAKLERLLGQKEVVDIATRVEIALLRNLLGRSE